MVNPEETGSRPASPTVRVKRERSEDDGEEEPRRVAQRAEENENPVANNGTPAGANAVDVVASTKEYVKTISISDDANVIDDTMDKLADCMFGDEQRSEKQQAFLLVGGPITIVTKLNKHVDSDLIQSNGIRVLINATCNDKKGQLKSVIADIGGIEAIIAAMNAHPTKSMVQQSGLMALFNMSVLEKNAEKLVLQLDGVPLITETMTKFSNEARVISEACGLLKNLSAHKKLRKPMIDVNVLSALVKAIEGHKDVDLIQKSARRAMKQLL